MLPVYVNGVRLLHDARYCAAAGARWIGYPCQPSTPNGLAIKEVLEILEWIEGPIPVLHFGEETLEMTRLCDSRLFPPQALFSLNVPAEFPPSIPVEKRVLHWEIPEVATPYEAAETIARLASKAHLLVVHLSPNTPETVWEAAILAASNVILGVDFIEPEVIQRLKAQAAGLCIGQKVISPEGELDFDEMEATGLLGGL